MLTFENSQAQGIVEQNLGADAKKELGDLDFQPFPDLDDAVKNDVEYLKGTKLVADTTTISGWVYDVQTGKVRHVA